MTKEKIIMKIKSVRFENGQGEITIFDKKVEKYTYAEMLEFLSLVKINCKGLIEVTTSKGEVQVLR